MAPKASPAAKQADHSCPILKLIMEKGPLSGQALDFRPGSCIRVGRVVRGNNLSIKDAGISSQHLLIQSEPTSDPGCLHWTITDLGSSNGTVLNESQIQASIPATLSDGDVVKIGETTAIKVKFEVNEGESAVKSGNARRYVKLRGKSKGTELGVIDENSELGSRGNDLGNRYNLRSKVANEKAGISRNEDGKVGAECEGKVFASTSGVFRNEEPVADLGKMTLGEWFDFLEVYLPKQIIDTTEEMISVMRQKADKLHELMLEQKNA